MKKISKKLISLFLCIFMVFSFALIANAEEPAEVTLSLDKATIVAGSLPATITMTVKTTKSNDLTSFSGKAFSKDSKITIKEIQDADKELGASSATTGKFAWMKTSKASVQNWAKVVFNIPADLAIGEYTLAVQDLSAKDDGNHEIAKATTAEVKFQVIAKAMTGIEIAKAPTKTSYVEGQNFDKTGMVVNAVYNDETKTPVTTYTVTNGNALAKGKTSVTISYTEGGVTKTTTQSIRVSAKALTGKVEVEGTAKVGEKATAKVTDSNNSGTLSYQWLRDGQSIAGATDAEYEITAEDVGKTISVAVFSNKEGGNITGAMTDVVAKADGAEAPADVKAEACTTADNNNGKITGVDETMEYQKDGDAEWTPVTGNEIANLAAGKYNVRYKETAGKNASAVASIDVPAFQTVPVTGISFDKKSVDLEAGKMAKLNVTVTPADASDAKIIYESSDPTVAKVDENGIVEALKAGTATITAKSADGKVTETCTVTITEHVCGINIPWWIWVIIAALAVAVIVLIVLLISKKKKK